MAAVSAADSSRNPYPVGVSDRLRKLADQAADGPRISAVAGRIELDEFLDDHGRDVVRTLADTLDALARLVALKDGPRHQAYRDAKELAWLDAREALAVADSLLGESFPAGSDRLTSPEEGEGFPSGITQQEFPEGGDELDTP